MVSRWFGTAEPPIKRALPLAPAALSAMAIALPRWAMASWKAERRSAWSPALPHHSIASIVEPSLGEMMGDRLGFGRCGFAQDFGRAGMQRLAAALEQAVVGRVLDQRVLEAIISLRRSALDKQKVGVGKPIQCGLKSGFVGLATSRSSA